MNNLEKLREAMEKENIDYYIIPSSDSHQSEYVAEHFKGREFISGFTGSAGVLLVGLKEAFLWTDGRYFIQAERELNGSGISLMKMRTPGYPTIEEWIKKNIKTEKTLGFDGRLFSVNQYKGFLDISKENNFSINMDNDLLKNIWEARPELPKSKIFLHEEVYSGKYASEKLQEVRKHIKEKDAKNYIISSLDDIAWLCNIRGNDVKFNPVALSYVLINENYANLYINNDKIDDNTKEKLKNEGFEIYEYDEIEEHVKLIEDTTIIDPNKLNAKIYSCLSSDVKIINEMNITTKLKAIKNEVEIANTEKSQVRDGVAMVKFIKWLKDTLGKEKITEISASKKLTEFRSKGENYKGDSFGTIAGYKEHAAMMHYSATEATDYELKQEGMFLVDSGGQYLDGTTDITRTFILGNITEEEKRDFTLVLKGHIALSTAKFLKGTTGVNLDILARRPLWNYGIDYKCGTGHGVGYFLNVHEGPQGIRPEGNSTVLKPGMIITNEPGVYKEGKHGIRIENTLLVVKDINSEEFGEFYKFKTISYCPIDLNGVVIEMLTNEERDWLNNYHKIVFEKLSPYLNDEEIEFLKVQTREI
ncbi:MULTISPECIES: aminopeptidase P family protein [Clostridium]|uniref:aminopeptidase P family protein n=1 Tax=Clostridium TaxID=1485 RepID=UPI0018AB8778|nr:MULTISPECIES: aminopeptidase P family protein [Clostridium]MBS5307142.1 aminopeptidase P family protein [Clostridium sp.]MDB1934233.1 aminopeptidase P family protein [Clostridium tertium]MDB1937268.1 aminopeptidase P family protein [Clostridium tertium]MDB1945126.1 aminopeptidase P family protein [Clostridium tertium]MDB1952410.1 aminopeptidase P family protein [Clostridium tertium]